MRVAAGVGFGGGDKGLGKAGSGASCFVCRTGLGTFEAAPFSHGGAGHFQADLRPFARLPGQAIDQRFLSRGETRRAAPGTGTPGDERCIVDQASFQPARPAEARCDDFSAIKQDGAFLADPVLDQPLSQVGNLPLSARRGFRTGGGP